MRPWFVRTFALAVVGLLRPAVVRKRTWPTPYDTDSPAQRFGSEVWQLTGGTVDRVALALIGGLPSPSPWRAIGLGGASAPTSTGVRHR